MRAHDAFLLNNEELLLRTRLQLLGPVALGMRLSPYRVNLVARRPWTKPRTIRHADLSSPEGLRRRKRLPAVTFFAAGLWLKDAVTSLLARARAGVVRRLARER